MALRRRRVGGCRARPSLPGLRGRALRRPARGAPRRRGGARLVAVHAWSDVAETGTGLRRRRGDWAKLAEEAGVVLAEEVRSVVRLHPDLDVRSELVHDTLRALLRCAQDARMVVVGHRGRRPEQGMGLSSTSQALVEFAPCPVIVTPPVPTPVAQDARAMGGIR
jgi:nucleotide-binding universal stress UspA family protein